MARRSPQTQAKRRRENAKREKREAKEAKKALRKAIKLGEPIDGVELPEVTDAESMEADTEAGSEPESPEPGPLGTQ